MSNALGVLITTLVIFILGCLVGVDFAVITHSDAFSNSACLVAIGSVGPAFIIAIILIINLIKRETR